jgi:hypothetical protein
VDTLRNEAIIWYFLRELLHLREITYHRTRTETVSLQMQETGPVRDAAEPECLGWPLGSVL